MLDPYVPEELTSYIVEAYVSLRAQSGLDAENGDQVNCYYLNDACLCTVYLFVNIFGIFFPSLASTFCSAARMYPEQEVEKSCGPTQLVQPFVCFSSFFYCLLALH